LRSQLLAVAIEAYGGDRRAGGTPDTCSCRRAEQRIAPDEDRGRA
jgi:hypothetical protein